MQRAVEYAGGNAEALNALLGFLESRYKLRKPIKTMRAMNLLLKKLDELSRGQPREKIALLDEATLHGWQSVYSHNDPPGPKPPYAIPCPPARVVESEEVRRWQ